MLIWKNEVPFFRGVESPRQVTYELCSLKFAPYKLKESGVRTG